jgi:hypothetical protein
MSKKIKLLMAMAIALAAFPVFGQSGTDSVMPPKQFKNTIRYNLSGPILFGFDYIVLGYERVLKNNKQSMSLNVGQAVLPKVVDFTSSEGAILSGTSNNKGYNLSLDYRFYLAKENKYHAPRGVYIGPFISFNQFQRDSQWKLDQSTGTTNANTNTKFDIMTIGGELGYQFLLGKRIALDFVLVGPGYANYKLKSVFDTNLTPEQKDKILSALQQMIEEKFPGMDYALDDASFNANGNLNTWNVGFRYIIHIGFRF